MNRHGYALVYSFLLLLALSMIGMGVVAMGSREKMVAAALERRAQASSLARAGIAATLEDWSTRRYSRLAVGEDTTAASLPGATVQVARLDTGLYVVGSVWAGAPDGPPPHQVSGRAAVLVRTFDPVRLASLFPAAATAANATLHSGTIQGVDSCGHDAPGLQAPSLDLAPAVIVAGDPPIHSAPPPPTVEPDPFGPLAARLASGPRTGSEPRPLAVGGRCQPDDRNWGSTDPSNPCHALLPFVYLTGPARLEGGSGRGVLVVQGDLEIAGDFHFEGIVAVAGRLTVAGAASVHGAVRAEHLDLREGAITRSRCALNAALSSPALDQPFRPVGRWWIPTF